MCTSALNIVTLNQTETPPLRRIERTPYLFLMNIGCLGGVPYCGGGSVSAGVGRYCRGRWNARARIG